MNQLALFDDAVEKPNARSETSSTFQANLQLPVHRWFRFSAGFSAAWAESTIRRFGSPPVLDPFAGSGTTLLAAEDAGALAIGLEAHPFVFRVAYAKLLRRTPVEEYLRMAGIVRESARCHCGKVDGYPDLIRRCYPDECLADLDSLRDAVEAARDDSAAWKLVWLTLVCILRSTSPVGTAQWQYVLPKKTKRRPVGPFAAFDRMTAMIAGDMRVQGCPPGPSATIRNGDARGCLGVPDGFARLVLTSPPYPNNYDYADATRLEMSFFGEVNGWGDLQTAARQFLIRSCTQHVPERSISLAETLSSPEIEPIRDELANVCERLAEVRETKGGKKTYHLMIACYFRDLARVWQSLRRVCAEGSTVCFVIGDSAPYGVYVPVMDWLGKLALSANFLRFEFERIRDRNVKWKNRKHRVPLCEGRLWVEG